MKAPQETLEQIRKNALGLKIPDVKRVLILYEEKIKYIGDCCIRFDKLRYFRSFFNDAEVSINFRRSHQQQFYINALLRNNPHLAAITELEWEAIGFQQYDVVVCLSNEEAQLLDFFHMKYGELISTGQFPLVVLSVSVGLLAHLENVPYRFPVNPELIAHIRGSRRGELYMSGEEVAWGTQWLESQGMRKGEHLFILLDSTANKDKLIPIHVHFDFLAAMLRDPLARVLIFDEQNIGKDVFYRAWLGDTLADRLIFSRKLTLREDLCIISSPYTRLLFGPCTGLVHCASGIYNNFVNNGMPLADVPLIVTYTGHYAKNSANADFWWGSSPLVHPLLLKNRNGRKQIVSLHELPAAERMIEDQLPCSEYNADMLIDYVSSRLKPVVSVPGPTYLSTNR